MTIVDRAKNIILTPAAEWRVIEPEVSSIQGLLTGYALPFMLILPVMTVVAAVLFGSLIGGLAGHAGVGLGLGTTFGLGAAISGFVFEVLTIAGMAFLINALAPTFGGQQNLTQAFKLVIYASTAGWLSGLALIVPGLGALLMFAASIYGFYTFYLGLPVLMKCPEEKRIAYLVVTLVIWIVAMMVFSAMSARF
jgi:hypothetical protein